MDIYCPTCGEPWDFDSLHERAEELQAEDRLGADYQSVMRDFQARGCQALGTKHGEPQTATDRQGFGLTAQDAASALYDLLGDDMDGAAAMLEDMGY